MEPICDLCKTCQEKCKQSASVEVVLCPHYKPIEGQDID